MNRLETTVHRLSLFWRPAHRVPSLDTEKPRTCNGAFLFSRPIVLFSGRGSYSGRKGRRNEMTDNNAGRNAVEMPCRDNSGGHSETWSDGVPGKAPHLATGLCQRPVYGTRIIPDSKLGGFRPYPPLPPFAIIVTWARFGAEKVSLNVTKDAPTASFKLP